MPKRKDPLITLLNQIQRYVDQLCAELEPDRPDLVDAIRVHCSWIPPREQLRRGVMPPVKITVRRLGPLLYDALDEGLVDSRRFDALMVERSRAERLIDQRSSDATE